MLRILALLLLCLAAAAGWAYKRWTEPRTTEAFTLRVAPGESLARALGHIPGLAPDRLDRAIVRYWSQKHSLRHGLYTFEAHASLRTILARLTRSSEFLRLTIVEGDNMFEVAQKLEAQGIVTAQEFLTACRDPELLRELLGVHTDRCEGYLWPETYSFVPYSTGQEILRTLVGLFWQRTAATFSAANFSRQQPDTIYRIVTLASVVEKETGAAHERPLIASVFLNRLIRGMRLQSDPTTIYGIWERFDGNLHKTDLQENTPYNTYRINGLPPTPIANPGLAAIDAALNPAASNYLYFVAKGSAGVHAFTENYDDHRAAIREFQLR